MTSTSMQTLAARALQQAAEAVDAGQRRSHGSRSGDPA